MEDLLPAAAFIGMATPPTWTQHIAERLPGWPPCAPARWWTPHDCLVALQWHQRLGGEVVTVLLLAHADRVEIGVWTSVWSAAQVSYARYRDLLTTVATLIIDQYADQDGPLVQLHVQPYDDTQASLQDRG